MEIEKAGDILSYGLGNELLAVKNINNMPKHHYLIAFVTYFAAIGMISHASLDKIVLALRAISTNTATLVSKVIARVILTDLNHHMSFSNFDELREELNKTAIPQWVLRENNPLIELKNNVYIVDDLIFFIREKDRRFCFRCVNEREVDDIFNYYFDLDSDNYGADSEQAQCYTISHRYSRILAYDADRRVFLLQFLHSDNMYAEYYVDKKQEVVHHHKCLGVIGNLAVIEADGMLAVALGDKITSLKPLDSNEKYEIKNCSIFVSVSGYKSGVFRPYFLLPDGTRADASYDEAAYYVLNRIKEDVESFKFHPFIKKWTIYRSITLFSLDFIENEFLENCDLIDNDIAREYYHITQLLKAHLPGDKDVLGYFYVMADISNRMCAWDKHLIGDEMCRLLDDLETVGMLGDALQTVDSFTAKLRKFADLKEDVIDGEPEDVTSEGLVGFFTINGDKIEAQKVSTDKAVRVADILMAPWQDSPGSVIYGLETGGFEIQYTRLLNTNEIRMILDEFGLEDYCYRVSIGRGYDDFGT